MAALAATNPANFVMHKAVAVAMVGECDIVMTTPSPLLTMIANRF
jgi:hypothetical protein